MIFAKSIYFLKMIETVVSLHNVWLRFLLQILRFLANIASYVASYRLQVFSVTFFVFLNKFFHQFRLQK